MRIRLAALLVLALLPLVGGCRMFGGGPDPKWVELPIRVAAEENLQEACLVAIQKARLKVGDRDFAGGKVNSVWDEDLFAFRRPNGDGGTRRRAMIEIKEDTSSDAPRDGRLARTVRVRVERQRNDAIRSPEKSEAADWKPVDDDVQLARQIAFTVQAQLGSDFRPSDDFYRRMGVTPPEPASGEKKNP